MRQVGWHPEEVDPQAIPADLQAAHLDRGERDTLALALILNAKLILMDETVGRKVARAHGLAVRGSLGILIESYRQGLIGGDRLRLYFAHRQDIWIARALVERLQREVLGI